jgi:hypothetical protein
VSNQEQTMTVKAPPRVRAEEAVPAAEVDRAEQVAAAVRKALGAQPGLLRVRAKPLWGDRFRVNVFAGDSAASARLTASYFVRAGEGGDVIESDPPLSGRG